MKEHEKGPGKNWPEEPEKPITLPPDLIVIYQSPWDFTPEIKPTKGDASIVQ